MVLDDLATYLQTAGLGTISVTLFKGGLPVETPDAMSVDEVLALRLIPGMPPDHVHDDVAPSVEHPAVQVLCRGTQFGVQAALVQAQAVWVALASIHNQTLSGTFYQGVRVLQSPWHLRDDEYGRPLIVFSILCSKAL